MSICGSQECGEATNTKVLYNVKGSNHFSSKHVFMVHVVNVVEGHRQERPGTGTRGDLITRYFENDENILVSERISIKLLRGPIA